MNVVEKITGIIEPSLDSLGYALVQIKMADGSRRKTLTIMAERKDEAPMGFDDCTQISRTVGALLEVEDPISGAYDLEVCSPGLDRPLVKPDDFCRYQGHEIKLETHIPMEGRKRFKGIIKTFKGETLSLTMPEGDVNIEFRNIRAAKLVVTDALLAMYKNQQGQH